jgi:predicted permease
MLESLISDIRFAFKVLRKNPGFSLGAILCLALALGVGTTLFLFVYATLLRPLPVPDPDRLVWISLQSGTSDELLSLSYPDLMDLQKLTKVFSGVVGYAGTGMALRGNDRTDLVRGQLVTANYFSTLGVQPILGNGFHSGGSTNGQEPEVVLSQALWQRRLGSDPGIVGKSVVLDGQSFTVVGVAPERFRGTQFLYGNNDLWIPVTAAQLIRKDIAERLVHRDEWWLEAVGRLKPGVSMAQAQAAVSALALQLESAYPESNKKVRFSLDATTLGHPRQRKVRLLVSVGLMVTAALIVLFASLNVTGLVLARTRARLKEIGIRIAVGASRSGILRQLVIETLLLFLLGGALALLLASWTSGLLARIQPPGSGPMGFDYSVDGRVILFTFLLAFLPGLLFGLAPALQASRLDVVSTLQTDLTTAPRRRHRHLSLRNLLLASQIAISLVLLVGSVLLLRSLQNTQKLSPGFTNIGAVMCSISLRSLGYEDSRAVLAFQEVLDRLQRSPEVRSAALVATPPLSGNSDRQGFYIKGQQPIDCDICAPGTRDTYPIVFTVISPGYFKTLGIPVLKGRDFSAQDREAGPYSVIINEDMAKRFWPGEDPLGKRFGSSENPRDLEVVGVVANTKYKSLYEEPAPFVYLPLSQNPTSTMALLVHAGANTQRAVDLIRREVREVNPNIPVYDITTMKANIESRTMTTRLGVFLLGLCGLLALALAAIGIYGLVSYSVSQRRQEIGLRMALGAQPQQVLTMVLLEHLALLAVGAVVGVLAAFGFGRLIGSFLFGVGPTDVATYAQVIALFALVTLIASLIPARRAAKLNPSVTLRRG